MKHSVVSVRLASVQDAGVIMDIQRETWLATYPNADHGITREDIRRRIEGEHGELVAQKVVRWRRRIEANDGNEAIFVARIKDAIVGFVAPAFISSQRRIGVLYVLPEAQGRGVGGELIRKALAWYGESEDVYLHVATYNKAAIGFYERFGFECSGEVIDDTVQPGSVDIPQIEMVRRPVGN